jgi:hypothetical protein
MGILSAVFVLLIIMLSCRVMHYVARIVRRAAHFGRYSLQLTTGISGLVHTFTITVRVTSTRFPTKAPFLECTSIRT